jgi:CheY-like chemotaxis protein
MEHQNENRKTGHKTTVMYVDDNPKSSRLLTSVLEESGFRVVAKNDPTEALSLCKRMSFDLALVDYEMPVMTGAKLAQELKYLAPDVPVVMISGRSSLPSSELAFVDAHFGFGTVLDDLLFTMRSLAQKNVFTLHPVGDVRTMSQWADST